jgi:hypothetical protein
MILNEDELRDNKETLDKYKEKLIDYEFSYDPRPFEITCKNISVRILEIVSLPNKET